MNSPKGRIRPARLLVRGLVVLGLLYICLLIPEYTTPALRGAGRKPFAWNQDPLWAELENKFSQARKADHGELSARIDLGFVNTQQALDELSALTLSPDAERFRKLETNLFELAAHIAALPERLQDYITIVTRARIEVKRQSERWDLMQAGARQTVYRSLHGARMALEEAMLQVPATAGLPTLIPSENISASTPTIEVHGVKLHSGDILISRGGAPTSALIARGNDFPGSFSHVALLHVDEHGMASVIESHIESGVVPTALTNYLAEKKLRIMVLRFQPTLPQLQKDPMLPHRAATTALAESKTHKIPYDFEMNYRDHSKQFCSEVVSAAYEPLGIELWNARSLISGSNVIAWLGTFGVRNFESEEPADLEYDPQLRVVAEWRDRETLFKAHVDDAVTDVMIEDLQPGEELRFQRLLLPVTRVAKAWSYLLNRFGKTGPIPEGMSATTALRVKHFRAEHAELAGKVLESARRFADAQSYTPPYWVLIKLAKEAKRAKAGA